MSSSRRSNGAKLFFEKSDFDKVRESKSLDLQERLAVISDMLRLNTLTAVMHANSGHLGASLSCTEVLAVLYHHVMKSDPSMPRRSRDKFILSKGHAASMLYAVLASKGFISEEKLLKFRRLHGLEGHADISAPGVDANTGSLGMGISKGKGYALANKMEGVDSSAFVMVGDGELQEGQNWEAIQSAAYWKLDNLYMIVDRNCVQTDMEVCKILDGSSIENKLKEFGWQTIVIDGHNVKEILNAFDKLKKVKGKPKAIIANTIKGKGVSFMEHPKALADGRGFYKWHDKVPNEEEYSRAWEEVAARIRKRTEKVRLEFPVLGKHPREESPFKGGSLMNAFNDCLEELGKKHKNFIVMDADLAESCGLRKFQGAFPERFVEIGIAEQDMISTAGGLALAGKLPIVNTYAAFLTSRSNEQIFNNTTEGSKVIYVGHLAGILPAKPGKSHQSIRDISLLKAIPNLILCTPCNAMELKEILDFLISGTEKSSYMRLEHFSPRKDVELPSGYRVKPGRGAVLAEGKDVAIIGYGPLLLSEALAAREELKNEGIGVRVINLPWLNDVDGGWLMDTVGDVKAVVCLENHAAVGGQSEEIMRAVLGNDGRMKVHTIGVEGFGLSGDGAEVLNHYGLDWKNLAKKIKALVKK